MLNMRSNAYLFAFKRMTSLGYGDSAQAAKIIHIGFDQSEKSQPSCFQNHLCKGYIMIYAFYFGFGNVELRQTRSTLHITGGVIFDKKIALLNGI
jgi:hypothetical protein